MNRSFLLCYLKGFFLFPGLKIFAGETYFSNIKSNAVGDHLSFACASVLCAHFTERDFCVQN